MTLAIFGAHDQCHSCQKFMSSKQVKLKHKNKCGEMKASDWRYEFPVDTDSRYFCFFGCDKFENRAELVAHLVEKHYHCDLKFWGLSDLMLEAEHARNMGRNSEPKMITTTPANNQIEQTEKPSTP